MKKILFRIFNPHYWIMSYDYNERIDELVDQMLSEDFEISEGLAYIILNHVDFWKGSLGVSGFHELGSRKRPSAYNVHRIFKAQKKGIRKFEKNLKCEIILNEDTLLWEIHRTRSFLDIQFTKIYNRNFSTKEEAEEYLEKPRMKNFRIDVPSGTILGILFNMVYLSSCFLVGQFTLGLSHASLIGILFCIGFPLFLVFMMIEGVADEIPFIQKIREKLQKGF